MTTERRIIWGIVSAWPFLCFGFVITTGGYLDFLEAWRVFGNIDRFRISWELYLFGFLALSCLACFGLYLGLLLANPEHDRNDRVRWLALFFLLGPLIFPIYWYCHVWHQRADDAEEVVRR